jgi:geranylgeranyl diphosphate synthase type I
MCAMAAEPIPAMIDVAQRVEEVVDRFLTERRAEAAALDPAATEPVDEIARVIAAGGKRIRPAFCFWGFRAAGGVDGDPIWRAAAALELLHTMALIHDDVLDGSAERRGRPATHVRQAVAATDRAQPDPDRVGLGVAIVTGDLAAVFAEQLFATSGFPADRLAVAGDRFHRMRAVLAAGAYLDLVDAAAPAGDVAYYKGGAYTVEYPLLIGAALAGSTSAVDAALIDYGRPLGRAFQLLDDLADGDAEPGTTRADALALVRRAADAAASPSLGSAAAHPLRQLADLVGTL